MHQFPQWVSEVIICNWFIEKRRNKNYSKNANKISLFLFYFLQSFSIPPQVVPLPEPNPGDPKCTLAGCCSSQPYLRAVAVLAVLFEVRGGGSVCQYLNSN